MRRGRLVKAVAAAALLVVLSALSVDAWRKHRRAETIQTVHADLRLMFDGSIRYYTGLENAPRFYPNPVGLTPAVPFCRDGAPLAVEVGPETWRHPTWQALAFAPAGPRLSRYTFLSSGPGPDASFTARAVGDLDCDGVPTTFEWWHGPQDHEGPVNGGRPGIIEYGDEDP